MCTLFFGHLVSCWGKGFIVSKFYHHQFGQEKTAKILDLRQSTQYKLLDGVMKDWFLADADRIPDLRDHQDNSVRLAICKEI